MVTRAEKDGACGSCVPRRVPLLPEDRPSRRDTVSPQAWGSGREGAGWGRASWGPWTRHPRDGPHAVSDELPAQLHSGVPPALPPLTGRAPALWWTLSHGAGSPGLSQGPGVGSRIWGLCLFPVPVCSGAVTRVHSDLTPSVPKFCEDDACGVSPQEGTGSRWREAVWAKTQEPIPCVSPGTHELTHIPVL